MHIKLWMKAGILALSITTVTWSNATSKAAASIQPVKHNLKVKKGGWVNGKKVDKDTILYPGNKIPGVSRVRSAAALPPPGNTTIIDAELGAEITIVAGSTATVGSFFDGADYQTYVELLDGQLTYRDPQTRKDVIGPGRKFIVRTKGRAIGAFGTRYGLSTLLGVSTATLSVSEYVVGIAFPVDNWKDPVWVYQGENKVFPPP